LARKRLTRRVPRSSTICCGRVVTDLKARLDPASFLNCGWNELEAFVDALLGGGIHHLRAALPARGAYPAPFAGATRLDDGGYYAPEPSVVLYLL
jgi:hypothetical protein